MLQAVVASDLLCCGPFYPPMSPATLTLRGKIAPSRQQQEQQQHHHRNHNQAPSSPLLPLHLPYSATASPLKSNSSVPPKRGVGGFVAVVFKALLAIHALLLPGMLYEWYYSVDPCAVMQSQFSQRGERREESDPVAARTPMLFHVQAKSLGSGKESLSTWLQYYPGEVFEYKSDEDYRSRISGLSMPVHVVWTDESCSALIEASDQSIQSTYTSLSHKIQKLDFCRYVILYEYGGVYHDADYSIRGKIMDYIGDGAAVVESPYKVSVAGLDTTTSTSSSVTTQFFFCFCFCFCFFFRIIEKLFSHCSARSPHRCCQRRSPSPSISSTTKKCKIPSWHPRRKTPSGSR